MELVFLLLILFQIKHFICDYPLQTPYMLGKMGRTNWIKPLAAHAGVHALGTFIIVYTFMHTAYWLDSFIFATAFALVDFTLHFIVDRVKASPDLGGKWKPDQPCFWWVLGADQMSHHLFNYLFIFLICILGVN